MHCACSRGHSPAAVALLGHMTEEMVALKNSQVRSLLGCGYLANHILVTISASGELFYTDVCIRAALRLIAGKALRKGGRSW